MPLEDAEAKVSSFLGTRFPSHSCVFRNAHREGGVWVLRGLLESMPYYWFGATDTKSFVISVNDDNQITEYTILDDTGRLISTAASTER